jgi:dienelactone hydrolase
MAFRAAVRGDAASAGVISVGSDVPPELLADPAARFPRVLFATGERDPWFTRDKHDAGVAAMQARGVDLQPLVYDSGHEWTAAVGAAAGLWLDAVAGRVSASNA